MTMTCVVDEIVRPTSTPALKKSAILVKGTKYPIWANREGFIGRNKPLQREGTNVFLWVQSL